MTLVLQTRSAEMDSQAFIAAQTSIMRLNSVAEALEMFAWSFRLVIARPCITVQRRR